MLGIKLADGTFYPILEEAEKTTKKVVLTTSHENQRAVKVPVFSGEGQEMANARPIGVFTIEFPEPPEVEPDLNLILGVDQQGNFSGSLEDPNSGEKQHISLSLDERALDMESFDMPDFEIDEDTDFEVGGGSTEISMDLDEYPDADEIESYIPPTEQGYDRRASLETEPVKESSHLVLKILFVALALASIFVLLLLLFNIIWGEKVDINFPGTSGRETPQEIIPEVPESEAPEKAEELPVPAPIETPEQEMEEEPMAAEPEVEETPEIGDTEEPEMAQETKVPEIEEKRVITYVIRWGDTLWDLSATYYRNPWLYGHIANYNKIENPDLIYAGEDLLIPEK